MTSAILALWLGLSPVSLGILGSDPPSDGDPKSLVGRLGSPRYSERESASRALLAIGAGAIDPLRAAREADDAEVQVRAEQLLQDIERNLLLHPTTVQIKGGIDSPSDLASSLVEQTGFPLTVQVADSRGFIGKAPTPGTSTFWDAMADGGLDLGEGRRPGGFRRFEPLAAANFQIEPALRPSAPSQIEGAFRLIARRTTQLDVDEIQVQCVLQAEPRLSIRPGFVELYEAEADDGESLLPARNDPRFDANIEEFANTTPLADLVLPVRVPSRKGAGVARLRGRVEFEVEGRRLEPDALPLVGEAGSLPPPLDCGDLTLKVVSFETQKGLGFWSLDLLVEPLGWRELVLQRGRPPRRRPEALFGDLQKILPSIVLVDDRGSPLAAMFQRQRPRFGQDGVHLSFEGPGPIPAAVHYYGYFREPVGFDFELDAITATLGR